MEFSTGGKLWWQGKRDELGRFMWREYPSTLDECFKSPVEGAIYADLIDRARVEGRVTTYPWDRQRHVHTFWDLGAPQKTVVWFAQMVGREIHVIDCDTGADGTLIDRVARGRRVIRSDFTTCRTMRPRSSPPASHLLWPCRRRAWRTHARCAGHRTCGWASSTRAASCHAWSSAPRSATAAWLPWRLTTRRRTRRTSPRRAPARLGEPRR